MIQNLESDYNINLLNNEKSRVNGSYNRYYIISFIHTWMGRSNKQAQRRYNNTEK